MELPANGRSAHLAAGQMYGLKKIDKIRVLLSEGELSRLWVLVGVLMPSGRQRATGKSPWVRNTVYIGNNNNDVARNIPPKS